MGRALTEEELAEYKKQRRETMKTTAELMGISIEELESMETKARAEIEKDGGKWKKKLNDRNKAKAGIIVDRNAFVPKRETASGDNPYAVERNALELLQGLREDYSAATESRILIMFESIKECLYPNRQALNYKALGETLAELGETEAAISAYEKGLSLNPDLPVKRKISLLQKQTPAGHARMPSDAICFSDDE